MAEQVVLFHNDQVRVSCVPWLNYAVVVMYLAFAIGAVNFVHGDGVYVLVTFASALIANAVLRMPILIQLDQDGTLRIHRIWGTARRYVSDILRSSTYREARLPHTSVGGHRYDLRFEDPATAAPGRCTFHGGHFAYKALSNQSEP